MKRLAIPICLSFVLTVSSAASVWPAQAIALPVIEQAALTPNTTRKNSFVADEPQNEATGIVLVVRQKLPDLLKQVTRRMGYRLTLSSTITGLVEGGRYPIHVERMMPQLAEQYALLWHLQDKELFVSSIEEWSERRIHVGNLSRRELFNAIRDAGVRIGNQQFAFPSNSQEMLVSGEASFITKMESIVAKLKREVSDQFENTVSGGDGHGAD